MIYEKADLVIGIVAVPIGAIAMMAFTAATFYGTLGFGQFTDAGAVAAGLEAHAGRAAGVMFALALLDASIIGGAAVGLLTAYAVSDVLARFRLFPSQAPSSYVRAATQAESSPACWSAG